MKRTSSKILLARISIVEAERRRVGRLERGRGGKLEGRNSQPAFSISENHAGLPRFDQTDLSGLQEMSWFTLEDERDNQPLLEAGIGVELGSTIKTGHDSRSHRDARIKFLIGVIDRHRPRVAFAEKADERAIVGADRPAQLVVRPGQKMGVDRLRESNQHHRTNRIIRHHDTQSQARSIMDNSAQGFALSPKKRERRRSLFTV